jgi:hypothetical protein
VSKTIFLSLTLAMTAMIGMPLQGGEPTCGSDAKNVAGCESLCPRCGCCLVPVCHTYCTTKKVTEYKYVCTCEAFCIPGVTPICKNCLNSENSGSCTNADGVSKNESAGDCTGSCKIRETRKLVKYPVNKETPVKKCTVEWVCPQCKYSCN